jgi:hypothetical protein
MFQNKFLNDFLRSQAQLVHQAEDKQAIKKDKKKQYKSKHGTASGEAPFGELTLETLISEKPAKAQVLEYFRDKIAALVAEEMNN